MEISILMSRRSSLIKTGLLSERREWKSGFLYKEIDVYL